MTGKVAYSTVKCIIGSVVRDAADKSPSLREIIDRRVCFVSEFLHRGSHIMLLVVLHYYVMNLELPAVKDNKGSTTFLRHCFHPFHKWNPRGDWHQILVPSTILTIIIDNLEWSFSQGSFSGFGHHLQLQCDAYATNFHNHALNIWTYINYTIKTFCTANCFSFSKDSEFVKDLQEAIKDSTHICTEDGVDGDDDWFMVVNDESRQIYLDHHRTYLSEKNINLSNVDDVSPEKIILYFVHFLKYQHSMNTEENPTKLFHPVPVHRVKR
jgi:hypothetical protein